MKKIIFVLSLIIVVMSCSITFAGAWSQNERGIQWTKEDGTFAQNELVLIDNDKDGYGEMYCFDKDGYLVINTIYDGNVINGTGQLMQDGIVVRVKMSEVVNRNGQSIFFAENDPEIKVSKTDGGSTVIMPRYDDRGALIDMGINPISNGVIGSGRSLADANVDGFDARNYIASSEKITKNANHMKTQAGEIWDDCLVLCGYDAWVKFNAERFNNLEFEATIAPYSQQTADTICCVEVYVNNELVDGIDSFNNGSTAKYNIDLDDTDRTIVLRLMMTGSGLGRQVYLRNIKFRNNFTIKG